jgi:hypothetical protein
MSSSARSSVAFVIAVLALTTLVTSGRAAAHDLWMNGGSPQSGRVQVGMALGDDFAPEQKGHFRSDLLEALTLHGAERSWDLLSKLQNRKPATVSFGTTGEPLLLDLVATEQKFTLPADKFTAYAARENAALPPVDKHKQTVSELLRRYAAIFIPGRNPSDTRLPPPTSDVLGLTLTLLDSPQLASSRLLRVRADLRGTAVPNLVLSAYRQDAAGKASPLRSQRSDSHGVVTFAYDRKEPLLIRAWLIEPCRDACRSAEFRSYGATLTVMPQSS